MSEEFMYDMQLLEKQEKKERTDQEELERWSIENEGRLNILKNLGNDPAESF